MTNRDILILNNPMTEFDEKHIALYECEGIVHSLQDFFAAHLNLLSKHEQCLVNEGAKHLPGRAEVPGELRKCLTCSNAFALKNEALLTARQSGARSAFWEKNSIKFKGCRPVNSSSDFPLEILPFGAEKIEHMRIPFGVMTAEGVMREVLGYCFLLKHSFPILTEPMCVYEYRLPHHQVGYCLVSRSRGEKRVESLIDVPDFTIVNLVEQSSGNTGRHFLAGSEINLKGLNLWQYIEDKSRQLSKMHFKGGFRGILNSNIGNDVIVNNGQGHTCLHLCDFDTFRVIPMPEKAERSFIKAFVLQCLTEVIMGSLPILEFVDLPEKCSNREKADKLGMVYFQKSSLWHAYQRQFFLETRDCGWDLALVEHTMEEMRKTEAVANILASCILNSSYLQEMSQKRRIFAPHH